MLRRSSFGVRCRLKQSVEKFIEEFPVSGHLLNGLGILGAVMIVETCYLPSVEAKLRKLGLTTCRSPSSADALLFSEFDFVLRKYETLFLKEEGLAEFDKLSLMFQVLNDFQRKVHRRIKEKLSAVFDESASRIILMTSRTNLNYKLNSILSKKYIQILVFLKENQPQSHPQLLIEFFFKTRDTHRQSGPKPPEPLGLVTKALENRSIEHLLEQAGRHIKTADSLWMSYCTVLVHNAREFIQVAFNKFEIDSKLDTVSSLLEISRAFIDQTDYATRQIQPLLESTCMMLTRHCEAEEELQVLEALQEGISLRLLAGLSMISTWVFSKQNFFAKGAPSDIFVDHPLFGMKANFVHRLFESLLRFESGLESLIKLCRRGENLLLTLQEAKRQKQVVLNWVEEFSDRTFNLFKQDFDHFLFKVDNHVCSNNFNAKLETANLWSEELLDALNSMKSKKDELWNGFWRHLLNLLSMHVVDAVQRFKSFSLLYDQVTRIWDDFVETGFPVKFEKTLKSMILE